MRAVKTSSQRKFTPVQGREKKLQDYPSIQSVDTVSLLSLPFPDDSHST